MDVGSQPRHWRQSVHPVIQRQIDRRIGLPQGDPHGHGDRVGPAGVQRGNERIDRRRRANASVFRFVRRALFVAFRLVVGRAFVVIPENPHEGLRSDLFPGLEGERIRVTDVPFLSAEQVQPSPMAQCVAVEDEVRAPRHREGFFEIERPVLGFVIPAVVPGVVDDISTPHEMVRVVRADLADRIMIGDDGHFVVRDPFGEPVASPDDGHHPSFVFIGDRVGPARGRVAVFFDQFARDLDGLPRGFRFFGHKPSEHVADAAIREVGFGFFRRAAVRRDEDAELVDEAVREFLGRRLDPQEFVRRSVGFIDRPPAEADPLRRAVVARLDFTQVDDDVARIVLVVPDDDRPVGAGVLADDDRKTVGVADFAGER